MDNAVFDIKVYGVEKRMPMIKNIMNKLDLTEDDVFLDDRPHGGDALYTSKKALLASPRFDITHRVVLQDDVEVCNNFKQIVAEIIKTHPDKIIALFPWDFYLKIVLDNNPNLVNQTPYVENGRHVTGCGFILPYQYIRPYLCYAEEHCHDKWFYEDQAWFDWAKENKITILNTIPALIQHLGDESLIFKDKTLIRRTNFYEENPQANWSSQLIMYK